MENLVRTLLRKDVTESTFNFFAYLAACAGIVVLMKIALYQGKYVVLGVLSVIELALLIQSFVYGLVHVVTPLVQSIWPGLDYVETMRLLGQMRERTRLRVLRNILFTKPTLAFLACYVGLFFLMGEVFSLFVEQVSTT